ncbi:MAG: hypothetical protein SFV54_14990 [Bryobacteraceae bacterium]|nr:hypothetical protein [Bryobacteraceae bacterium]
MKATTLLFCALSLCAADFPVREVVLFKHGVGFFGRAGTVKPGQTVRLDFDAAQMDDVLKSLILRDSGGAGVAGLRYDSSEPLAAKLAKFPFALNNQQPLATLIDQFKGARIELELPAGARLSGSILAARFAPATQDQPAQEYVTLLLDSGDLKTASLTAALSVRLSDPALQSQLKDYLSALGAARSQEKRSVYLDFAGAQPRSVEAAYMIPMPVWKSSYRLVLAQETAATLEGWAIIDNTTSEDWDNVRLAVVSGRPISFISRLYEPRYRQRAEGDLPEDQAAAPVLHQSAVMSVRAAAAPPPPPAAMARGLREEKAAGLADALEMRVDRPSSIQTAAYGREAGDLFEYRFDKPVVVRKNESAMLPFLQQKLEARKLLIYADTGSLHPTAAAEITNASGKTLDGGPVTVYDGGSYAGEALFETFKSGDKRLISYAVDLGTRVTTNYDSTQDVVREVLFRRGVILARSAVAETRTYTIKNIDAKAKTLLVEHRQRPGYKLLSPKPVETTANFYRFEVKLAPTSEAKLAISEERILENSIAVSNLTPDLVAQWTRNKALSEDARKRLDAVLAKKREIAENDAALRRTETEISELNQDQSRLRENLNSLNRVTGQQEQVQRYAKQLADQELQMATLRDRLSAARRRKATLEAEQAALIEALAPAP